MFYDKETTKVHSNHTGLAVISLDFVHKNNDSYYQQKKERYSLRKK